MRLKKLLPIVALTAALVVVGVSCSSSAKQGGTGQQHESHTQQNNYNQLVNNQPAHTMTYSPSRDTINAWIDAWTVRGQLAFTYIKDANGQPTGYYIFQGPPITYCASLTPNYKLVDPGGSSDNGNIPVNAPSIDGVFYSGGQCNEYIAKDASTGNVFDFTVGMGQSFQTTTQPLYQDKNLPALGQTSITEVHKDANGDYVKQ